MSKAAYRWAREGSIMHLYEQGVIRSYDKPALERALHAEESSECPPGVCSFRWYRTRTNAISKFKQGLELLDD